MGAGFYRFDVHFYDGDEQNAHGFVYAESYATAIEQVYDFVEDADIADIKIEGMEPGAVLLTPDWIADKITKYDYFGGGDYKLSVKNVQFENANSAPTAKTLSQGSIDYINECVRNSAPIELPHYGED